MHLRFIAEGWDKDLDYMEKWVGTMVMPMPYKDKDGKEGKIIVPAYLRPFRMYDLIFPREQLDKILNTLKPQVEISLVDGKGTSVFKNTISIIRKFMRLKKIPKADESKGIFPLPNNLLSNLRIIGLGIHEDKDFTNEAGITQETI